MIRLDISGFQRDAKTIKSALVEVDDKVIAKKNLRVIFPTRFLKKGLADISTTALVTGIVAIVDDDGNYGVMNIPIGVPFTPFRVEAAEINGLEYSIMYFEAMTVFIDIMDLVIDAGLMYPILEEFMISGRVPWYMNYEDVSNIFVMSKKYTDTNIGVNILGFSLLTAIIARDPKNKKRFLRLVGKSREEIINMTPTYIGLGNIYYAINSTLSKEAGAYAANGLTSAMVDPQEEISNIELLVRS